MPLSEMNHCMPPPRGFFTPPSCSLPFLMCRSAMAAGAVRVRGFNLAATSGHGGAAVLVSTRADEVDDVVGLVALGAVVLARHVVDRPAHAVEAGGVAREAPVLEERDALVRIPASPASSPTAWHGARACRGRRRRGCSGSTAGSSRQSTGAGSRRTPPPAPPGSTWCRLGRRGSAVDADELRRVLEHVALLEALRVVEDAARQRRRTSTR